MKTSKCFVYNNTIVFAVPREMVSRAIGPAGINIRNIQEKLGKKVKVISEANELWEAERFTRDVVSPLKFKSIELKDDVFVLTAGSESKAALIGRNRRRLDELNQILKDNFGKEVRII